MEKLQIDEYVSKLQHFDKNNQSRFLQKIIEYSLEASAVELPEVSYTRENYNSYFNRGQIESPISSLKMGENQFEKFAKEDRNNLMKAAYLTLVQPSIIIEKDSYDRVSDTFKPLHVYGKSFYRIESGNKHVVESVIVFKDENNVVIGSHDRDIDNFVKQIKTADQIIFADSEVSRVITQLNKEVGNPVSLYGMNTEALNPRYDKNLVLSSMENKIIADQKEILITQLTKENARLKEENLRLGKQVFEYQKEKLLSQKANKLPKRWNDISENGLVIDKSSFVDGHPTISQQNNSATSIVRNISTLNDYSNIPQSAQKSSANKHPIESKKPKDKSCGYER